MSDICLSYTSHRRFALTSAPLGPGPAWCPRTLGEFFMCRQCFEHSEHLKRCTSYLQARTPGRGAALREVMCGRAHLPLFPARAGPCPECHRAGVLSAQVLRRQPQDCPAVYPGTAARNAGAVSPKSHGGPQKRGGAEGRPPGCVYPNRLLSTTLVCLLLQS